MSDIQAKYREVPPDNVMLFWMRNQIKTKQGMSWARNKIKRDALPLATDWSDPDSVIGTMLMESCLDTLFKDMVSDLNGCDVLTLLEDLHGQLSELVMRYEQYERIH